MNSAAVNVYMYLFESLLSIAGAYTWEWHCGVIAKKKSDHHASGSLDDEEEIGGLVRKFKVFSPHLTPKEDTVCMLVGGTMALLVNFLFQRTPCRSLPFLSTHRAG